MKCPTCGSDRFYLKDDEDEYEIYEFTLKGSEVQFDEGLDPGSLPNVTADRETYCDKCAWHGAFDTLT